jgi:hypothetical protein
LRHIAVSCLLTFLLACTTSPAPGTGITDDACQPIVVVPGPDTSPEERAAVAAGIALWKQRGVSPFTLDDVPGAPRIPLTFQDAAAIFHGYYDPAGGQVFINRALTDPHQRAVTIAHELGHALGGEGAWPERPTHGQRLRGLSQLRELLGRLEAR